MLKKFIGTHRGFQTKRRIGEIFEVEGERWVVIQILNMKLIMGKTPIIKGTLVAQQIGKYIDYSHYYKEQTITDRIPPEDRKPWDKNIKQVGELINLVDDKRNIKRMAIVTGIESFEYEFVDLIVNYRVEAIEPWSEQRMNKAIQENRLSTFKVLTNEE